jgi:hypothetical protein
MADCGTLRIAEGTEIGRLAIAPDDGCMQGVDDGNAALDGVGAAGGLAPCSRARTGTGIANLAQGRVCKILDQEAVKPHKVLLDTTHYQKGIKVSDAEMARRSAAMRRGTASTR